MKSIPSIFLILLASTLSACQSGGGSGASGGGGPGPSGGAPDDPVVPDTHTYVLIPMGDNEEYAGSITVDVGTLYQFETLIHQHIILPGAPQDVTVTGENVVANFSKISGAGTLTVELWRDGILFDTKSTAVNGTSISFSVDF